MLYLSRATIGTRLGVTAADEVGKGTNADVVEAGRKVKLKGMRLDVPVPRYSKLSRASRRG